MAAPSEKIGKKHQHHNHFKGAVDPDWLEKIIQRVKTNDMILETIDENQDSFIPMPTVFINIFVRYSLIAHKIVFFLMFFVGLEKN
jgi:hypothetical protein